MKDPPTRRGPTTQKRRGIKGGVDTGYYQFKEEPIKKKKKGS